MDFFVIVDSIIAFFQANTPLAIAAAVLIVFFAWTRPKFFITLFFIVLLLAGALYLISNLSTSGAHHKKTLIQKQRLR